MGIDKDRRPSKKNSKKENHKHPYRKSTPLLIFKQQDFVKKHCSKYD